MRVSVSVIICCYNSAGRIGAVLEALAKQELGTAESFEIVVVDNASTDSTADIARANWTRPDVPFQVVTEGKPGLSHARDCGVAASSGEILVFCDDDNLLAPNFLKIAAARLKGDRKIGLIGGQGEGRADVPLPEWFDEQRAVYACGPQSARAGPARLLFGAGLVIRRCIWIALDEYQFPKILSGRKGSLLSSGEDSELGLAARILGWQLEYEPAMRYVHLMPRARLTIEYLIGLHFGIGSAHPIVSEYERQLSANLGSRVPLWVHAAVAQHRALWRACCSIVGSGVEPKLKLARMRGLAFGYRKLLADGSLWTVRRRISNFRDRAMAKTEIVRNTD